MKSCYEEIKIVAPEIIYPLREEVIIKGTDRSKNSFDGDHEKESFHTALLIAGEVLACASFFQRAFENQKAFQLRGMAVKESHRGKGLGYRLMQYSEAVSKDKGIYFLWANARIKAVNFYLKMDWVAQAKTFEVKGVGPHKRITKKLL